MRFGWQSLKRNLFVSGLTPRNPGPPFGLACVDASHPCHQACRHSCRIRRRNPLAPGSMSFVRPCGDPRGGQERQSEAERGTPSPAHKATRCRALVSQLLDSCPGNTTEVSILPVYPGGGVFCIVMSGNSSLPWGEPSKFQLYLLSTLHLDLRVSHKHCSTLPQASAPPPIPRFLHTPFPRVCVGSGRIFLRGHTLSLTFDFSLCLFACLHTIRYDPFIKSPRASRN